MNILLPHDLIYVFLDLNFNEKCPDSEINPIQVQILSTDLLDVAWVRWRFDPSFCSHFTLFYTTAVRPQKVKLLC